MVNFFANYYNMANLLALLHFLSSLVIYIAEGLLPCSGISDLHREGPSTLSDLLKYH